MRLIISAKPILLSTESRTDIARSTKNLYNFMMVSKVKILLSKNRRNLKLIKKFNGIGIERKRGKQYFQVGTEISRLFGG